LPGQQVQIRADVTESAGGSDIKAVFLCYRVNGNPWWNTTMIFNNELGLYETTIPDYGKHDFIEYFVRAFDNAGRNSTTAVCHYEVLRCDVNYNGVVDVPDIYMIGKAWNTGTEEPGFIPEADINEDGIVNSLDLEILSTQYGKDP